MFEVENLVCVHRMHACVTYIVIVKIRTLSWSILSVSSLCNDIRVQGNSKNRKQLSATLLGGMEQFLDTAGSDISDKPFRFNGTNIVCKF